MGGSSFNPLFVILKEHKLTALITLIGNIIWT